MTDAQYKALTILKDTNLSLNKTMGAAGFATKMWEGSGMHTKHSNGGNGCQVGKAAWLCGGSYLAKLRKKGLTGVTGPRFNEHYITRKGREELIKENERRRRLHS